MKQGGAYRKTRKRWEILWDAHFITFSCFQGRAFFSKDRPREWFLESLGKARLKHPFDLWGFVLMPEHVHLLIWPHEGQAVSDILKSIKQPVTQRAVAWLRANAPEGLAAMLDCSPGGGRAYRFWQVGGGHDRNMRTVRETHEKLTYIHNNPVKRGLVERPEEWAWSSARAWATGTDQPAKINRESFPILELNRPWES
jgi:putative transposase